MQNFFSELMRRNVFRVGAAYMVIGWLIVQVATTLEEALALPEWVDKVVVVLLLLGFPVAIIISWAYELTPEGLQKTEDVDPQQSITGHTGKRLNYVTISAVIILIGFMIYNPRQTDDSAPNEPVIQQQELSNEATAQASIAVLPFVNLSSDPEQEFFSDGISEELLNVLAKIPDLHVTSRSSAFSFKGKDFNIPDVARELGVAHVLEGSVRKSGNKIRITAQLIEASSDKHIWSETYDRTLDDIFAIQDEISDAIVNELIQRMGLKVDSPDSVHVSQSVNTEAYTTFLLASHQMNSRTPDGYREAWRLLNEVKELDPTYAPTYANMAIIQLLRAAGYGDELISMEQAQSDAKKLIDLAIQLDPNLAEAYAAKGLALRFDGQNFAAIETLSKALELNSSHSRARNWLSMGYRVLHRSRDELDTLIEGHARDPLAPAIAFNLVKSYSRFGMHKEAEKVLKRIESISLANNGASKGEMMMLRGRYSDGVEAAIRGEDAMPGKESHLTLNVAAYILAALGERDEALRIDPWKRSYGSFNAYIDSEVRDHEQRLAFLLANESLGDDPWVDELLVWSYLGVKDYENAIKQAKESLMDTNSEEQNMSTLKVAMAIGAYGKGHTADALEYISSMESIVNRNLDQGDDISLYRLIKAVAEYMRGNESAALDNLRQGIMNKAPMSFEGINHLAIFAALGWEDKPEFANLLAEWEAYNQTELRKIFSIACGKNGFDSWQPHSDNCKKYALSL